MFFKSKLKFSSVEEGEKNLKFLRRLQKFPFNLIINQSLIQSDIDEVSVKLSKMVSKRSSMRITFEELYFGVPFVDSNFIKNQLRDPLGTKY